MKVDADKIYTMPLIIGPLYDREDRPRYVYKEVEILMLQYRTDPEACRNLIPDCFSVGEEAIVTITFGDYDGVGFMAGGGYRTATFGVSARFDGQEENVEGQYIFVMCEDKTLPIIAGREQLGVPKVFADISPIRTLPDGILRSDASLWGHLLFGIELKPVKKQNAIVRAAAARRANKYPWLGYKYIPSFDGPPDADYPTVVWIDFEIERLWLGKEGTVNFGSARENDISYGARLVDALKTMPVLEVTSAARMRGSSILRNDKSRRLR